MRSRTGQMAHFVTKVSVTATMAMMLAMLGVMLPRVSAGFSPADDVPPAKITPKGEPAKPAPAKVGLLLNDSRAFQGYTLIAPMFSNTTYLIDMVGKVVRTWESDYTPGVSAYILENGHLLRPGAQQPTPSGFGPGAGGRVQEFDWDGQLLWDFAYVSETRLPHHDVTRLPNGNVLMIVWEKKKKEEVIAAGRRPDMVGNAGIHPDYLIEVKPTGKTTGEIVWEWHLWDHLIQDHDRSKPNFGNVADHPELVDINFGQGEGPIAPMMATKDGVAKLKSLGYVGSTPAPEAKDAAKPDSKDAAKPEASEKEKKKAEPKEKSKSAGRPNNAADWTHFNGVAYNPDLDQIVVSVHAFSEFWIIDHSTTKAEAASHTGGRSGKGGDLLYRWGNPRAYRNGSKMDQRLFNQHNAHWIKPGLPGEGHMLVFNNGSGRPGGDSSSVDEIVLPVDSQGQYSRGRRGPYGPAQAVWSYSAPKKPDFYSFFISGAQRLPNGNTLICSGASGTVFEVTPDKEIVWKYANPVVGNPGGPGGPGRPGGPGAPRGVDLFPFFVRDQLDLTPEQSKQIEDFQKDFTAKLDKTLNDAQKKQVSEINPFGPQGFAVVPLPGQLISKLTLTALKPTAEQQKQLDDLQKEVDAKLATVLNADQKKQVKEMQENVGQGGPFAFGPPGGGGGPPQKGQGGPPRKGQGGPQQKGQGGPPGGPGGPMMGNTLFRAPRYGPEFPGLAGKTLKPGKTIEEMEALKKASEATKKPGEAKKTQETAKKSF
jgi:Arylsulfotransferase (ASST)